MGYIYRHFFFFIPPTWRIGAGVRSVYVGPLRWGVKALNVLLASQTSYSIDGLHFWLVFYDCIIRRSSHSKRSIAKFLFEWQLSARASLFASLFISMHCTSLQALTPLVAQVTSKGFPPSHGAIALWGGVFAWVGPLTVVKFVSGRVDLRVPECVYILPNWAREVVIISWRTCGVVSSLMIIPTELMQ